jgi:hypothetical protein
LGFFTVTLPLVTVSFVHFLPPSKDTYTFSDLRFEPAAEPCTLTGTLTEVLALEVLEVESEGLNFTVEAGSLT